MFGYNCVKNVTEDKGEYKCRKFWGFEDGIEFDLSKGNQVPPLVTPDSVCKTHFAITIDQGKGLYQCRKGAVSKNVTKDEDYERKEGISNTCNYTSYDDPADPNKGVDHTVPSQCGFNKDDSAWCPKQRGDKAFKDALEAVQNEEVSKAKCHVYSNVISCQSAISTIGEKKAKTLYRELVNTQAEGGFPNYANNANCIAKSITSSYWQGDNPDFAFGGLTMSSFATIVLTISALFYMF
jgi:hypothetical protein